MKIHGLSVVKNEEDIIEPFLHAAAEWCAAIYVLDNGSEDETWARVQVLAKSLPQVVPFRQDERPFDSGIREEILRHYSARAQQGDWWCILDADEFYIDDPREFLRRVPRRFRTVWKQDISYFFTEEDAARYREDPSLYSAEVPVEERLRYYSSDWSEMRFFRHRIGSEGTAIPWAEHRVYPERIRVKHFQYRSPEQIQKRLETRRSAMLRGSFPHEKRANWSSGSAGGTIVTGPARLEEIPESWEERVVPTSGLHFDARDGTYAAGRPWSPPAGPSAMERLTTAIRSIRRRAARLLRRALRKPGSGRSA